MYSLFCETLNIIQLFELCIPVVRDFFDLLLRYQCCQNTKKYCKAMPITRNSAKSLSTSWNVVGMRIVGLAQESESLGFSRLNVCLLKGRMEEGSQGQALGVRQEARCKMRSNSS